MLRGDVIEVYKVMRGRDRVLALLLTRVRSVSNTVPYPGRSGVETHSVVLVLEL